MNIACLAWGSLVWDPKRLPIYRTWFDDGPFAPVEFSRLSKDGRITLVIDTVAKPVRLLWAPMTLSDIEGAMEALSKREGITATDWKSKIGNWKTGDPAPPTIPSVPDWAKAHGLDAVIWTALGPRYKDSDDKELNERPRIEWILNYLQGLVGTSMDVAKQYFCCAPKQIDTEYRRRVESVMGWNY